MKLHHTLLFGLVTLIPFTGSLHAAESVQDAFRRGLLAEETTRDMKAAVEAYSEAVRLSSDQRAIEATALFRLAECQKKLGNATEATATLQRLAREYPEQRGLLAKSGIAVGGASNGSTSIAAEVIRNSLGPMLETIASKTGEIESLLHKKAQLAELNGVKFAARVPAEFTTPELSRLIAELNQVGIRKAGMIPDFGPEHPDVKRLDASAEALRQLMREQQLAILERIDEAISEKTQQMQSLRKRSAVLEERLEAMEAARLQEQVTDRATPLAPAAGSMPGPAMSGGNPVSTTALSEADLRSQIDSLSAELEVLQKLPDALERGRFIASRHREQTSDQFRSDVTTWSTLPSSSRTNDYWHRFESSVTNYTRPIEDRLRFARMELEVLQKQRADRAPWQLVIIGHVSRPGVVEVERSQKLTVSQAVQMSGGPTDSADLKKVVVRRKTQEGKQENIPVNLDRVLNQGDTSADLILLEGDRVLVPDRKLNF